MAETKSAGIPPFELTPIDAIPGIVDGLRKTFRSQKTKPIEYRLKQLRKLWWGLKDNEDLLQEALKKDLNKSKLESVLLEISWMQNDIIHICNNLEKWAKDEPMPDTPLMYKLNMPRFRKEPMGVVLVIGAFNFPVFLSLGPFIGAIAAGCTGVLKPSESSPATAMVLQKIIADYLDPEAYTCLQGAIPEVTALLDQKWDKICFTGSPRTGSIIAKKAAETLTPCLLELGGRNPAILGKGTDTRLAARRLLWGKIVNAGQICLSQNYILVDRSLMPSLVEEFKNAYAEFYPDGALNESDYARIVNEKEFNRLKKMLEETRGRIVMGGTMDEKRLLIEPTVVEVDDQNDSLVKDESFGPLIPILPVDNLDEAIKIANEVDPTPLALYPFGDKKETEKILQSCLSGGASINDAYMHASIFTGPLGGVGTSGVGSHHGKYSFEAFTHKRLVTNTPAWMESLIGVRYPPYNDKNLKQLQSMTYLKPNFDREGNLTSGMLGWLVSLGSSSTKGGIRRWILVAFVSVLVRKYLRQSKL